MSKVSQDLGDKRGPTENPEYQEKQVYQDKKEPVDIPGPQAYEALQGSQEEHILDMPTIQLFPIITGLLQPLQNINKHPLPQQKDNKYSKK